MYKYLFIVEVYPDDYLNNIPIEIDRYGLEIELNPNAKWALEDQVQDKINNDYNLFKKLSNDYIDKHFDDFKRKIKEKNDEELYPSTLLNNFINSIYAYVTIVNPNDQEMIDTWKSLPKINI